MPPPFPLVERMPTVRIEITYSGFSGRKSVNGPGGKRPGGAFPHGPPSGASRLSRVPESRGNTGHRPARMPSLEGNPPFFDPCSVALRPVQCRTAAEGAGRSGLRVSRGRSGVPEKTKIILDRYGKSYINIIPAREGAPVHVKTFRESPFPKRMDLEFLRRGNP